MTTIQLLVFVLFTKEIKLLTKHNGEISSTPNTTHEILPTALFIHINSFIHDNDLRVTIAPT